MKELTFLLLLISFNNLFSQIYDIPGATEQPAWVFPLWIEDASGAMDTLYYAYDPMGQDYGWPQSDSVFGEKLITIDTTKFNAYWTNGFLPPQISKVVVWGNLGSGTGLSFINSSFPPLKIKWDPNLFYNSQIPYPDLSPLPIACGELITLGDMSTIGCSYMYPVIMTDTTEGGGLVCYFTDSVNYETGDLSGLNLTILQWKPNFATIQTIEQKDFEVFPIPVTTDLNIQLMKNITYTINLYDVMANLVKTQTYFGNTIIYFNDYSEGIYYLNIISNDASFTYKIIKK